jgi:hypothetical protein
MARSVHYAHRAQAAQALAAARAMLTATEVAILDMMAARGASLNGIARQTRRSAEDLWDLYAGACDKLAAHFGLGAPATDATAV